MRRHEHRGRPARPGRPAGRRPAGRPAHRAHREDGRRQQRHALLRRRARPDVGRGRDPDPAGRHAARRALADLYGDVVLDVDVKPNRGDALSIVGLAREVAAVTGAPLRFPPTDVVEGGRPTAERLSVDVRRTRPLPALRRPLGERRHDRPVAGPVQMRLLAAGMRPISNVVDASNYVMVELGKPIHTFDAAAVHDGRIVVRLARRASASRPSTTSCASCTPTRCSSRTRPDRWRSPGSWAGHVRGRRPRRPRSSSSRPSSTRSASAGRPSATRCDPTPASASRKGSSRAWRARRRPDGPADRGMGRRRRSPRASSIRTRSSPRPRTSRSVPPE